jgi:hypothetical protein
VLTSNLHWFFDDSGSEPTHGRHFILGGFLSTAEGWTAFSNEWQETLSLSPSLEYMKMSEAASLQRHSQFSRARGWTEDKRDERVRKLGSKPK